MNESTIKQFPNFLPISLDMHSDIAKITSRYPNYHDFSIGNLYCWDTDKSIKVCILNNNLVVQFVDYIDESNHFLSFLGNNKTNETVKLLLKYSQDKLGVDYLRYVPEISVSELNDTFTREEVRNDFDYIYDLSQYSNEKQLPDHIRPEYNSFINKYGGSAIFTTYEYIPQELNIALLEIFSTWENNKADTINHEQERKALINMINFPQEKANFWTLILYDNEKPIGFTINEITTNKEFAIGHFCKADINYKRIFDFLTVEAFIKLSKLGVKFFNMEPDLGIEGLRNNKLEKQPSGFLKKYTVKLKKTRY